MVFSYIERDEKDTGGTRRAPELVSVGLGKPYRELKARSPHGLIWILATAPMISARLSLNPSSLQLSNLPETRCRSHSLELVLGRGWGHNPEARGKSVGWLGRGFIALIYCRSSLTSSYLLLLAG